MLMVAVSSNIMAQATNISAVPEVVASSFHNKYPNTTVERWKASEDKYIAKVSVDNHTCFVSFDANGNWICTMSKIRWTHQLPKTV